MTEELEKKGIGLDRKGMRLERKGIGREGRGSWRKGRAKRAERLEERKWAMGKEVGHGKGSGQWERKWAMGKEVSQRKRRAGRK